MGKEEFEKTVFVLKDKLFRFARSILNDGADAEDVVQELMVLLWNKRKKLKKLDNIESYSMRSVKNMCLDKLKHYKVRQRKMGDIRELHPNVSDDNTIENDDIKIFIKKAINTLPEKQKQAIYLRDIEGYTFEEMEAVLDMNTVALRVNLSRARKKVKEEILKIVDYGVQKY